MTTEEAIRLYQEGGTITEICSRAGMSYFGLRRRLIKAGVTLRPAGKKSDKPVVRKDTKPKTEETDTKWAQSLATNFLSKPLLRNQP